MSWQAQVYGRWRGSGRGRRRKPKVHIQRAVLERQGHRCAYCDASFGEPMRARNGRYVTARCYWDHFVPYVHDDRQVDDNWLASCQVCNGIKHSLLFESIIQAKDYILAHRWHRNVVR